MKSLQTDRRNDGQTDDGGQVVIKSSLEFSAG